MCSHSQLICIYLAKMEQSFLRGGGYQFPSSANSSAQSSILQPTFNLNNSMHQQSMMKRQNIKRKLEATYKEFMERNNPSNNSNNNQGNGTNTDSSKIRASPSSNSIKHNKQVGSLGGGFREQMDLATRKREIAKAANRKSNNWLQIPTTQDQNQSEANIIKTPAQEVKEIKQGAQLPSNLIQKRQGAKEQQNSMQKGDHNQLGPWEIPLQTPTLEQHDSASLKMHFLATQKQASVQRATPKSSQIIAQGIQAQQNRGKQIGGSANRARSQPRPLPFGKLGPCGPKSCKNQQMQQQQRGGVQQQNQQPQRPASQISNQSQPNYHSEMVFSKSLLRKLRRKQFNQGRHASSAEDLQDIMGSSNGFNGARTKSAQNKYGQPHAKIERAKKDSVSFLDDFKELSDSEDQFKNSLKRLDPPRILITPSPDDVIPNPYRQSQSLTNNYMQENDLQSNGEGTNKRGLIQKHQISWSMFEPNASQYSGLGDPDTDVKILRGSNSQDEFVNHSSSMASFTNVLAKSSSISQIEPKSGNMNRGPSHNLSLPDDMLHNASVNSLYTYDNQKLPQKHVSSVCEEVNNGKRVDPLLPEAQSSIGFASAQQVAELQKEVQRLKRIVQAQSASHLSNSHARCGQRQAHPVLANSNFVMSAGASRRQQPKKQVIDSVNLIIRDSNTSEPMNFRSNDITTGEQPIQEQKLMNKSNGFSMIPKGSYKHVKRLEQANQLIKDDPMYSSNINNIIVGSTELNNRDIPSKHVPEVDTHIVKQSFGLSGSLKRMMENLSIKSKDNSSTQRPGSSGRYIPARVKMRMSSSHSANFFRNLNSQIRMLRRRNSPQRPNSQQVPYSSVDEGQPTQQLGERGGTGSHIMMEFNPEKGRVGFFQQDREIEVDESHYAPLFFANDVEELRNNPKARKILREYQIFTGANQNIEKPELIQGVQNKEENKKEATNINNNEAAVKREESKRSESSKNSSSYENLKLPVPVDGNIATKISSNNLLTDSQKSQISQNQPDQQKQNEQNALINQDILASSQNGFDSQKAIPYQQNSEPLNGYVLVDDYLKQQQQQKNPKSQVRPQSASRLPRKTMLNNNNQQTYPNPLALYHQLSNTSDPEPRIKIWNSSLVDESLQLLAPNQSLGPNSQAISQSIGPHSLRPPGASGSRRYSHEHQIPSRHLHAHMPSATSLLTPSFRGAGSYRPESPSPSNQMSEFSFAVNSSGQKNNNQQYRRNSGMSITSSRKFTHSDEKQQPRQSNKHIPYVQTMTAFNSSQQVRNSPKKAYPNVQPGMRKTYHKGFGLQGSFSNSALMKESTLLKYASAKHSSNGAITKKSEQKRSSSNKKRTSPTKQHPQILASSDPDINVAPPSLYITGNNSKNKVKTQNYQQIQEPKQVNAPPEPFEFLKNKEIKFVAPSTPILSSVPLTQQKQQPLNKPQQQQPQQQFRDDQSYSNLGSTDRFSELLNKTLKSQN